VISENQSVRDILDPAARPTRQDHKKVLDKLWPGGNRHLRFVPKINGKSIHRPSVISKNYQKSNYFKSLNTRLGCSHFLYYFFVQNKL